MSYGENFSLLPHEPCDTGCQRQATLWFFDPRKAKSVAYCKICEVKFYLEMARKMVARIPELEAQLAELERKEFKS